MGTTVLWQSTQLWQLSGYASVAAWAISAWDWMIRFDDEVTFIWPMGRSAHVKWLYFIGAYVSLTVQAVVSVVQLHLAKHPVLLAYCRIYRGLEMMAVTAIMLCFNSLLLLRTYALYGRHAWSSMFATLAVVAEFVTTVVSAATAISTTTYDSGCVMTVIPKSILLFVVGTFLSQFVLLWLAYRKRDRGVRSRLSIICVTIRDGVVVFFCITAFLLILFIFVLHNSPVTTMLIYFLPVFPSIGTCRIILNLQRVPYGETTRQFTTGVEGLDRSADSFLLSDIRI